MGMKDEDSQWFVLTGWGRRGFFELQGCSWAFDGSQPRETADFDFIQLARGSFVAMAGRQEQWPSGIKFLCVHCRRSRRGARARSGSKCPLRASSELTSRKQQRSQAGRGEAGKCLAIFSHLNFGLDSRSPPIVGECSLDSPADRRDRPPQARAAAIAADSSSSSTSSGSRAAVPGPRKQALPNSLRPPATARLPSRLTQPAAAPASQQAPTLPTAAIEGG